MPDPLVVAPGELTRGVSEETKGYGDIRATPSTDEGPRCWKCGKKLAEFVSRPWSIRCGRCKSVTNSSI